MCDYPLVNALAVGAGSSKEDVWVLVDLINGLGLAGHALQIHHGDVATLHKNLWQIPNISQKIWFVEIYIFTFTWFHKKQQAGKKVLFITVIKRNLILLTVENIPPICMCGLTVWVVDSGAMPSLLIVSLKVYSTPASSSEPEIPNTGSLQPRPKFRVAQCSAPWEQKMDSLSLLQYNQESWLE